MRYANTKYVINRSQHASSWSFTFARQKMAVCPMLADSTWGEVTKQRDVFHTSTHKERQNSSIVVMIPIQNIQCMAHTQSASQDEVLLHWANDQVPRPSAAADSVSILQKVRTARMRAPGAKSGPNIGSFQEISR